MTNREAVERELAEELGFDYPESWEFHLHHTVRDALVSREMRVRELEQKVAELKAGCNCELPWTGDIPQPICAVHPTRAGRGEFRCGAITVGWQKRST